MRKRQVKKNSKNIKLNKAWKNLKKYSKKDFTLVLTNGELGISTGVRLLSAENEAGLAKYSMRIPSTELVDTPYQIDDLLYDLPKLTRRTL